MLYIIYKALDNPPSFVGLKGSYIKYAAGGLGVSLIISLIVGSFTNGLIAVILFTALAAAAYLGVMAFQAKYTERERMKWMSSKKLMDVITFPPEQFSTMANRRLSTAEKLIKKE